MKITEPKIDQRAELPYAAIRSRVAMSELGSIIPQHIDEVAGWLAQRGVEPAGPPIIRYYMCPPEASPSGIIDMAIGWPVANEVTGDDRIEAGALPAGRYASLVFTGVENGIAGNGALIQWARDNGIQWDSRNDPLGEVFRGRVEHLLDGPDDDPDPANWKNEVAILMA